MSDQLSFVLGPALSHVATSSPIHLLPFSLGSTSNPYASTSASISAYFQPRPCPADHPSFKEGTPIAAFRGRQLVGQELEVPAGYKGIVLRTSNRPDRGGGMELGRGQAVAGKWPLTPSTSVASSSSMASVSETHDISSESSGARRSPRKVKGSGQVALSKPRQSFRRGLRKRLRLDSDSEDENEAPTSMPVATTPKRGRARETKTPVKAVPIIVPEIKVQGPTPRKPHEEEPVPQFRLRGPTGMDDHESYDGAHSASGSEESVKSEASEEPIVPSPSTEDQPPLFKVEPGSTSGEVQHVEVVPTESGIEERGQTSENWSDPNCVRQLRPVSRFESITLWTPDAPLGGFRQDEVAVSRKSVDPGSIEDSDAARTEEAKAVAEEASAAAGDAAAKDAQALNLNKGWWRVGGAGEGGDDFVRGMGEWIGLVQVLNDPVYLQRHPEDENEEED
ncbi:ribonuclease H2, subunit C, partial [Kockovaella imperatae]